MTVGRLLKDVLGLICVSVISCKINVKMSE